MIDPRNYYLACEYLEYLDDICRLDAHAQAWQWRYLKYVLIWVADTPLHRSNERRPTLPVFLANVCRQEPQSMVATFMAEQIIQAAKGFFVWLKLAYGSEYRDIPLAWIEELHREGLNHRGPLEAV